MRNFRMKSFVGIAAFMLVGVILAGCATSQAGQQSEVSVIDQAFTDVPLRDVLISIEKTALVGIAVDSTVELEQPVTMAFEKAGVEDAVRTLAENLGYQSLFDPQLPESMAAPSEYLHGQYWPNPTFLIAKDVNNPIFVMVEAAAKLPEEPTIAPPAEEAAVAQPTRAEEEPTAAPLVPPYTQPLESQPKVSNVFFNTDIREAISDIAGQTGVNIISDASVEGAVTLSLDSVPLEKALSMVCLTGGFTWMKIQDYYIIGATAPDSVNYSILSQTKAMKTHLPASQVKNRLSLYFDPYVRVANDDDHVLIVTGSDAVVQAVLNSIQEVDSAPRQVLIEALVTDITWSKGSDVGMNWMDTLASFAQTGDIAFATGAKPAYSSTTVGTILAELRVLARDGKMEIKAHPTVVTLEGQPAELKIVEERYFVILTGTVAFPTSELTVIESGVKLNVTPEVTRSGEIELKIVPDVSDVTGMSGGTQNLPLINRRTVSSTVRVKDGQPVIIGGLNRHLSREIIRKVPILGSIPIINFAFKNTAKDEQDTDLLILITPRLLPD